MLTREQIEKHVLEKGPYLYHRAPAESLPLILRQGLLPWDAEEREDVPLDWDEGSTTIYADSRMSPRSDHVYIGTPGYVRRYHGIMLRIDLRELDPLRLDSDEDHFDLVRNAVPDWVLAQFVGGDLPPREWGSWSDYIDPDCPECEGVGSDDPADCPCCEGTGKDIYADPRDEDSLGEWADRQAGILDAPEFVAHSLASGSLAVRGQIPAQAVSLDPLWLPPEDLRSLARVFAEVEIDVEPFTVLDSEEQIVVAPDRLGGFELPEGVRCGRVEVYVQEARGERLLELFNSGELLKLERPSLAEAREAPGPAAAPSGAELDLAGV